MTKLELARSYPDLQRRAMAAYFRTADVPSPDQPAGDPEVIEHDGKLYVVLSNTGRALAVYRVQNNGILRRMKRWPREIAPRD
jgi:hypothetical protein